MFLFSGGCPSAYIKQSLFIHSTSGNGGKPVKKIPASATVLPTMKVEVQSPYNRIILNRTVPASIFLIMIQSPVPYLWLYNHPENTLSASFLKK